MASDLESSAKKLSWQEFEIFVEKIFSSLGFETLRNYRLRKPRIEIDLLAWRNDFAIAVDCKHWKRTVGQASMTRIGNRQALRSQRVAEEGRFRKIMPVIVTLRDESLLVLKNGLPIVPITRLNDFLVNFEVSDIPILILESKGSQMSLSSVR